MIFDINTKQLKSYIGKFEKLFVSSVAGKWDAVLKVTADKDTGRVKFEAAEKGCYVRITIPAVVTESGTIVLASNYLVGLRIMDEITTFKVGEKQIEVTSGKFHSTLEIVALQDTVESNKEVKSEDGVDNTFSETLTLKTKQLKDICASVLLTPQQNDPDLVTLFQISKEKGVKIAVNDHYRAAVVRSEEVEIVGDSLLEGIIPINVLTTVFDAISSTGDIININTSGSSIHLWNDWIEFIHPFITKKRRTDPEERINSMDKSQFLLEVSFNAKEAEECVLSTGSITEGIMKQDPRVSILFEGEEAKVMVKSSIGKATSSFPIKLEAGKKHEIIVSGRYMREILSLLKSNTTLQVLGDDAVIFRGDSHKFQVYVMPQIDKTASQEK